MTDQEFLKSMHIQCEEFDAMMPTPEDERQDVSELLEIDDNGNVIVPRPKFDMIIGTNHELNARLDSAIERAQDFERSAQYWCRDAKSLQLEVQRLHHQAKDANLVMRAWRGAFVLLALGVGLVSLISVVS